MTETTSPAQTMRMLCAQKAAELWAGFTANEKIGARFGMFPAEKMRIATMQGLDSRVLAVALMDCAAKDGGMRA
jgi:hypothetical protein